MKHRIYILMLAVVTAASCLYAAAGSKDNAKDFDKMVAKEVKTYKKQNWKPAPGQQPLETQIEAVFKAQTETDANGEPVNLTATAIAKASKLNDAQFKATELARQELATLIESNVSSMVELWTANEQLSATEAKTISRMFAVSRQWVTKTLYKVNTIASLYRTAGDNGYEVMMTLAYPVDKVRAAAQQSLIEQLEDDQQLKQRVDSIISNTPTYLSE